MQVIAAAPLVRPLILVIAARGTPKTIRTSGTANAIIADAQSSAESIAREKAAKEDHPGGKD